MGCRSARAVASAAWYGVAAMTAIATLVSFQLQPKLAQSFVDMPFGTSSLPWRWLASPPSGCFIENGAN
jgi:hypothetical protein